MALIHANNAYSTLGGSLTNVATLVSLATGTGTRFPAIAAPAYMYATLQDGSNNIEIVKITAHSAAADSLTVVRGQDGTTARSWNLGDAFEARATAGSLSLLQSEAFEVSTHAATAKTTPADADEFAIVDSAASNVIKKVTGANIKAWVFAAWGALINGGTGKTTPVDADAVAIMDSADSNATKKLTWANIKATLKTYFDTLYGYGATTASPATGDYLVFADVSDSNNPKKSTIANVLALVGATTDQVARDQIALTNIRLLLNSNVATGALVQGKQWELASDEWGATSTNETYTSSTPNYYGNPGGYSQISTAGKTLGGNMIGGGGVAAAFDGTTAQARGASANTDNVAAGAVTVDFGAGVTKTVSQVKFYSSSDFGYNNDGAVYNAVGVILTVYGSNDGVSWTQIAQQAGITNTTGSTQTNTLSVASPASYRHYKGEVTWSGRNVWPAIAELQLFETAASPNMTLIPDAAVSVSSAPSYMDAYFLWKDDSGSAVLGTDLTVELSRDGGTTYTTATCTNLASYDGTYSIIRARADVSGQPSGTSMLCRIKTLNNKNQRIAAPALYSE